MTQKDMSDKENSSNLGNTLEIDNKAQHWEFFDVIRSIGIILIVFIHSTVYNYGLFEEVDLENLNPIFMIFYVLLNWAGLFGIISAVVNTYSSYFRYKENLNKNLKNPGWNAFGKRWIFLGLFFLCLNLVYNFLVSPFVYDFDLKIANHSFIPGVIRTGELYIVSPEKILQGSTFSMLGWNLIVMGIIFSILFSKSIKMDEKRKRQVVLTLGIVIILISVFRIYLYDDFNNAIQNGNFFLAYIIDVFFGSYFPLLPYLGFGLIGAYIGLLLGTNPLKKTVKKHIWVGIGFFIASVIAFLIPDSLYANWGLLDDILFSYIIILFEIGIFITLGVFLILLMFDKRSLKSKRKIKDKEGESGLLLKFSTNSLTFFLLERPMSEIFALILNLLIPGWNNEVWTCLLFGGFMVLFWIIIAKLWSRIHFKYSFEWFLTKLFQKVKYQTDKSY